MGGSWVYLRGRITMIGGWGGGGLVIGRKFAFDKFKLHTGY